MNETSVNQAIWIEIRIDHTGRPRPIFREDLRFGYLSEQLLSYAISRMGMDGIDCSNGTVLDFYGLRLRILQRDFSREALFVERVGDGETD